MGLSGACCDPRRRAGCSCRAECSPQQAFEGFDSAIPFSRSQTTDLNSDLRRRMKARRRMLKAACSKGPASIFAPVLQLLFHSSSCLGCFSAFCGARRERPIPRGHVKICRETLSKCEGHLQIHCNDCCEIRYPRDSESSHFRILEKCCSPWKNVALSRRQKG